MIRALRTVAAACLVAFATQVSASDERATLRAKARAAPVRVIVRLPNEVQPEGLLPTAREVDAQRSAIASAQSSLVTDLPTVGYRMTARFHTIPFAAFEVDAQGLAALERSPMVTQLWEDRVGAPALFQSDGIVQADQSWAAGFDGSGKVIAIVDSGIARGADIVAIAAFHRETFCDPHEEIPCARYFDQDLIKALEHVLDLQTRFDIVAVNMSLVGVGFTTACDDYDPALAAVMANLRSRGIAPVVSAGNDGVYGLTHPACSSAAVSVGAVDKEDRYASFSNFASFLSLAAPGAFIWSSVPGGLFDSFSGTSMAAPHVAGAWAILRQQDRDASVDRVLAALRDTGAVIRDPNGNVIPRIRIRQASRALAGETCGTWTPIGSVRLPATFFDVPAPAYPGRGTQITPDLVPRALVIKDVRGVRWAISRNYDGTVTGNVFTSKGAPPQFVLCTPEAVDGHFSCSGATACTDGTRGIVETPDGRQILVNKNVGGRRWAITRYRDTRLVTGNVFGLGLPHPRFVYCFPNGVSTYGCLGADPCVSGICSRAQWRFLADVTLPCTFFGIDECSGFE